MLIDELSKKLEVTAHTLRIWEKIFNIDVIRDEQNNRDYNNETIKIFEKIKELKELHYSTNRIKETLGNIYGFIYRNTSESISKSTLDVKYVNASESIYETKPQEKDLIDFRTVIRTELNEQTELAEKYAKATYMIGQLEAEKRALEEKLKFLPTPDQIYKLESEKKSLEEKLQLLPAPDEIYKLQSEKKALEEKINLLPAPDEFTKITTQNEMLKEEKERLLDTINEFDKVKEENITIKQKLSLFPEPEVFNQIKQKSEHLENENLILQRHVQKLLDEVDYHKLSWWDKLCLKLNKNQKMVVHKVNVEAC